MFFKKMPLCAVGENSGKPCVSQTEKQTLTVMTYNVRNCGNGKQIAEIAGDIRKYNPDVVCVQEVDCRTTRSRRKNILKSLADALQMHYCFFPAIYFGGGTYGIGILSVYPLENCTLQPFTVRAGDEGRVLAHAQITVNGRAFHVFNTHLSYESPEMRLRQMQMLSAVLGQNMPFVLMGDFNILSFQEYDDLRDVRAVNGKDMPFETYIGDDPTGDFRAIDNIFIPKTLAFEDIVFGETSVSDHRPLIATVSL